jgi:hypothetical protein
MKRPPSQEIYLAEPTEVARKALTEDVWDSCYRAGLGMTIGQALDHVEGGDPLRRA